jgi:hypothetical protein
MVKAYLGIEDKDEDSFRPTTKEEIDALIRSISG